MEYRNIAIISHVDHGKTTLVDGLLQQTLELGHGQQISERAMDSNVLEKERGITILAKNTAVEYEGVKINIVDTPGHTDFGGEVERVLGMVDGCLLLVDAAEGPMPQTRFVLRKAIELDLKPILVVNKVDRMDARPDEVVDLTFDLMADLGASDEQLDFPILYAIAREGRAFRDVSEPRDDMRELFETVLEEIPAPEVDLAAPFQMLVTNLDYSEYLGRIVVGRVRRGEVRRGESVNLIRKDGTMTKTRVVQPFTHLGLQRIEAEEVGAGDIVALSGIESAQIGETIADLASPEALPTITVDEPTVSMMFGPSTSPFAGREGRYVTSRHLRDRLKREVQTNVSLRVEELRPDEFEVSGRGELHLSILLETMRREGYEVQVSAPRVITREVDGKMYEPFEHLVIDVPERFASTVIGVLSGRKGHLVDVVPQGSRSRVEFEIPARALFGFRTKFLSMTQGECIMSHVFDGYAPRRGQEISRPARTAASWRLSQGAPSRTPSGSSRSAAASLSLRRPKSTSEWSLARTAVRTTSTSTSARTRSSPTSAHPAPTTPSTSRPSESCHSRTLSNISVRTSSSRSHQSPSACAKRSSNRACGSKILRSAGVQVSCLIFLKLLRSC